MGCCQSKAPRVILSKPPTLGEGKAEWSPYTDDLAQIVPTFDGESKSEDKKFYTWDRNAVTKIRYAASGFASEKETPAKTVTQLFKEAASGIHANEVAMLKEDLPELKKGEKPPKMTMRDTWTMKWTWAEYYADCRRVGKALLSESINMQPKDSVCIFGFNSPEWIMGALGATLAGGKYSSERAAREWSTVVDISIHPPSFKLVLWSLSRSPLSKIPKQVFFNPINIFDIFYTLYYCFIIYFFV